MKISVVTAVMNGRETLPAMLESLACQSFQGFEHVVQDGGSTDGTGRYLAANGLPQMRFHRETDSGLYDAINRGITRATGDVIGLLHADDRLASPDALELIADAMRDDRIDGVYADLQYVSRTDPARVLRHWRAGPYRPALLRQGWMPPHPTLYLRREVFAAAGLYDTGYQISGDYDAMLRFLTQGNLRLGYIPQVLVQMKLGGVSNKSFAHILRKSREDYRAIRRHGVGGVGTLIAKNVSKLPQLMQRG